MDIIPDAKTRLIIQDIYRKIVNEDGWKDRYDENPEQELAKFDLNEEGKELARRILAIF